MRLWINVIDVDSMSQQRRVPNGKPVQWVETEWRRTAEPMASYNYERSVVKNGLTRLRIWFIIFVKSKELLEAGQCLPVPLYFIICSLPVHKNDKKTADVINPNYFEEQYIIIEQVEFHWIFLSPLFDYNTALQRRF